MGREVDADLLVGAAEIAERLNLSHPQSVHTLRRRHPEFPDPVAMLSVMFVWHWPDVERWAKDTGRLAS